VSRTNILFHELAEKLLMVTTGIPKYGGPKNNNTAHKKSSQMGVRRVEIDGIDGNGADGNVDKREQK
jgi:hypothetical protein